jgi:hypothetical protein
MNQVHIEHSYTIPSKYLNYYTGSDKFEEGFHSYRLSSIAKNSVEKVVLFKTSLDKKKFYCGGEISYHNSLKALLEIENIKSAFYQKNRKLLPIGFHSFSSDEIEHANQIWNEMKDDNNENI